MLRSTTPCRRLRSRGASWSRARRRSRRTQSESSPVAFDLAPAISNLLTGILGDDNTIKSLFGDDCGRNRTRHSRWVRAGRRFRRARKPAGLSGRQRKSQLLSHLGGLQLHDVRRPRRTRAASAASSNPRRASGNGEGCANGRGGPRTKRGGPPQPARPAAFRTLRGSAAAWTLEDFLDDPPSPGRRRRWQGKHDGAKGGPPEKRRRHKTSSTSSSSHERPDARTGLSARRREVHLPAGPPPNASLA